jgi:hypothetical protein
VWECKGGSPYVPTPPDSEVDLALIPKKPGVVTSQDSPDTMWLAKGILTQASDAGATTQYGWTVPGYLPSGDYLLRVEAHGIPQWGDSVPITIKSQIPAGTAFLNPDEPAFEVLGAFFDGIDIGQLAVKVRCTSGPYTGDLIVDYDLEPFYGSPATGGPADSYAPRLKDSFTTSVDLAQYEVKTIPFLGYSFAPDEYGNPQSPPLYGTVWVHATVGGQRTALNQTNASIFKTPKADIVTDRRLYLSPDGTQNWTSAVKGTTITFYDTALKWVTNDSFEGGIRVQLFNWGGTARTFSSTLYVDDLPGVPLGDLTLSAGERRQFENVVTFKINPKAKDDIHQIVFIADQPENNNQPYPNSYMNNFIQMFLKINRSSTLIGGS